MRLFTYIFEIHRFN